MNSNSLNKWIQGFLHPANCLSTGQWVLKRVVVDRKTLQCKQIWAFKWAICQLKRAIFREDSNHHCLCCCPTEVQREAATHTAHSSRSRVRTEDPNHQGSSRLLLGQRTPMGSRKQLWITSCLSASRQQAKSSSSGVQLICEIYFDEKFQSHFEVRSVCSKNAFWLCSTSWRKTELFLFLGISSAEFVL